MISLENVTKIYRTCRGEVRAMSDLRLHVDRGEFLLVRGPSGSGKTTLLLTIAGMVRPTRGTVRFDESDLYAMSTRARARFRAEKIGFVFQTFHLVPYLNVLENVMLAAATARDNGGADEGQRLLSRLGLAERAFHKPSELSVGEKQRTAIARALFNQPQVVLADEPTGNLDADNATAVFGYLADFHRRGGTVIVVSHGAEAEQFADRMLRMEGGSFRPYKVR